MFLPWYHVGCAKKNVVLRAQGDYSKHEKDYVKKSQNALLFQREDVYK